MRIITDKAKNEIGKRLSAIYYIALHGYGKDTASDIDSTTKIIENLHEIAYKVGGERFSNVEMPAYILRLQSAIQREKEAENGGRRMSLVLKGEWHMPKKCRHCLLCMPYETRADGTKKDICIVTGKLLVEGEAPSRPKGAGRFCPLVELPERHGRLIDADAFAEHLREAAMSVGTVAPQVAMAWEAAVRDLEDQKKTPTIVDAEGEEGE